MKQSTDIRLLQTINENSSFRHVFSLCDDSTVEMAVFHHNQERHICISTQVGCPVGCRHCATTYSRIQYQRNLQRQEICAMIDHALTQTASDTPMVLSFSGHGEPMLNWETVLDVKRSYQNSFAKFYVTSIGERSILEKIAAGDHSDITFYLSLHGTTDAERSLIIRDSTRFSTIDELMDFAHRYSSRGGNVVLNYMLHKGNSSIQSILRLLDLLNGMNAFVSLRFTDYTPVCPDNGIERLRPDEIDEVLSWAAKNRGQNERWKCRYSCLEGRQIGIACGQLRAGLL